MTEIHRLGCDCETCWHEFRAHYVGQLPEPVLRQAFDVGTATARAHHAARAGAPIKVGAR